MKTVKKILLSSLLFSLCFLQIIAVPLEPLIKYPTQQELEEVEKLLSTLSPEELDELTKLGEELIKTAEAEGRPLFGPAPEEFTKPTPTPDPVKPVPAKPTAAEVRESSIPKKQLSDLQKMLSDLVDALGSIRQKASSDEKLAQILEPITNQLNSLAYYLRTIAYSQHAARLTDKEFVPLKESLSKLGVAVEMINDTLIVEDTPSTLIKKTDSQKMIFQQTQTTLTKFVDIISNACTQQNLLNDLEAFMKKYEPEALEIKNKQDKQDKDAIAYTKKIPSTNAGTVNPQLPSAPAPENPISRGSQGQGTTGVKFGAPVAGNPLGVKPAKPAQQNGGTGSNSGSQQGDQKGKKIADAKKTDDKKEEKKKEEMQDAPQTIDDQTQELKNKIVGLNNRVIANKSRIDAFFNYLYESPDELATTDQIRMAQPIGELYYEAVKIKNSLGKWVETIGKTSDYREARMYQDSMQKIADTALSDFKELMGRIDTVLTNPDKSKRVQGHEEELKDLKKISRDVTTIRIKPK